MKRASVLLAAAAMLTIGAGTAAWARGGGGGHGGGPGGFGRNGILEQLINPCASECAQTAHSCQEAVDAEAVTCIAGACSAEVTAAQSACTERPSEACRDALSALRVCGETCLETRASDATACRGALVECRDACDATE